MAARLCTVVGGLALALGVTSTVARTLPGLPGLAGDTWAMITAFSDHGLLAYACAIAALTVAVLAQFGFGRVVAVVVTVGLLAVHASWIVPRYLPDQDQLAGGGRLVVAAQNLLFGGADPSGVLANAATADVLVVVEMTEPAARALSGYGIEQRFPYHGGGPLPDGGPTGTRIYSRYPILESRPLNVAGGTHNWLIRVDAEGLGPVNVVAAHPTRPVLGGTRWAKDQENLRSNLPRERTVVAGDFNAVTSHLSLRRLSAEGFRGAAEIVGAGWQPTFPAGGRIPPLIDIDHVLVSEDLTTTAFATVHIPGSDHRGVLATVALRA